MSCSTETDCPRGGGGCDEQSYYLERHDRFVTHPWVCHKTGGGTGAGRLALLKELDDDDAAGV
eukprot:COSAG01_NODE_8907_length_2620_cov_1.702102_4_plen_62_part_01